MKQSVENAHLACLCTNRVSEASGFFRGPYPFLCMMKSPASFLQHFAQAWPSVLAELKFFLLLLFFNAHPYFLRFYLFLEREGKEKERDRNINVWLLLTCPPTGDLACNPGTCPRLGIKLLTLWFAAWHWNHWATPAGAIFIVNTITDVLIPPTPCLYPPNTYPPSLRPSPSPSGHVCVYGLCIHVLWLIPSPCFIQSPSSPLLWQLSVCSIYACLCFYFISIGVSSTSLWRLY